MKISPKPLLVSAACLIVLLVALALGGTAGCSSQTTDGAGAADGAGADATSSTETVSESSPASTLPTDSSSTTTVPPVALSPYQEELARTATVQNDLAQQLSADNVASDDPRMALILGLRARVQALSCAQALSEGDLELARQAMVDVYSTLNRGRSMAESPVAEVLNDAHATIEALGDPSDDPERAARLLDDFLAATLPLLDLAAEMAPSATTST